MENLINAKNKEYIAILLEEHLENLVVDGVDHLSEDSLKSTEQKFMSEENQFRKIIESDKK